MTAQDVLNFWFHEIDQKLWFSKDLNFDEQIRSRFLETYDQVTKGETKSWRQTPQGRLAEIIVLDQFSRNMFRNSPKAFEADDLALKLAQEAVQTKDDQKLSIQERAFLYMPYMHSEDQQIHEEAVKLFSQKGLEFNLKFELMHKAIIDRFGRYPHRNDVLGRKSTPEEVEFLKTPGSSF